MRQDIQEELGIELINKIIAEMQQNNYTEKDFYSLGERRIYQARCVFANQEISQQKIKSLRLVRLKELQAIKRHSDRHKVRKAINAVPKLQFNEMLQFKLYMLIWAWCVTVLVCITIFNKSSAVMILFAVVIQYLHDVLKVSA